MLTFAMVQICFFMEAKSKYIKQFQVRKMWGRINIDWKDIYKDVNILVGINGGGKTTFLNLINDYYNGKLKRGSQTTVEGNEIDCPLHFIRSFDIPANGKKKTESMLLQELKDVINQNGEGTSFFDYRMKMLNFPKDAKCIQQRIDKFFEVINSLFEETNKEITIDPSNNTLVFNIKGTGGTFDTAEGKSFILADGKEFHIADEMVQLDQLSSGEKQIILILTTVFLQEEKPNILLMDEPEISLHINWQERLIEVIRQLNPNCQLILATHSPTIFTNGWEDKIVFIEDLIVE